MAAKVMLFVALCLAVAAATDLPYWTSIPHTGDIPLPLWDGASAYDSDNELFYIFGGLNGTFPNDIQQNYFYVFDVQTQRWTNLSSIANGPSPRAECMMWVDKDGDVLVSGGRGRFRTGTDLTLNDTYAFDADDQEWQKISQSVNQQNMANRSTEAVVGKKKAYSFSGSRSTLPAFINRAGAIQDNVIVYKKSGWANLTNGEDPKPRPRAHHPLAFSKKQNSLFTYGGYTNSPTGSTFAEENYLGDFWQFNLSNLTWSQISFNTSQSPGKRDNMKLVVDDQNDRIWGIGGADWTFTTFSDVWYFDLVDGSWTRVDTEMQPPFPPATIGAYHFYRKVRRAYEFYIFGGSLSEFGTLTNTMWKLTLPV